MSVEYYRKRLIDLRADVAREREAKKRDNEHYADLIKGSSSTSTKASYRKSKIDHAASHDRAIDHLKGEIERAREELAREREREKAAKKRR
ncbi:MAG: hypothetical protein KBT45_08315 [Bacteroidales bacterium]|nr:hypothetical protein [Candidatus Colimorpha pelethequi]